MNLPLFPHGAFGNTTGLLLGTLIGMGFGFVLERAGFGRARNLAAQFYLTDTRVLKVMFSAIVTALTGMAILSGIGLLDISQVTVPETFLWPQLAGGLLLGAGFIISGYCPGTSAVAAASGNLDGAVAILGMMAGSLAFGFGFGPVEKFYQSGSMGVLRINDLLGVPMAVVAAAVVAMAVGAFLGGEKVERIFARRAGQSAPPSPRAVKAIVFGGFAAAAVLSLFALALPAEKRAAPTRLARTIEPIDLAGRLIAAPENLWLLDLRTPESVARGRIPGAMTLSSNDPSGLQVGRLSSARQLVVYAQGGAVALPRGVQQFGGEIFQLRGGYDAWQAAVLAAPTAPERPTPELIAEFRLRSAFHSRYTGAAAVEAPRIDVKPSVPAAAAPRKGGGC